jgi:hypothetical protein
VRPIGWLTPALFLLALPSPGPALPLPDYFSSRRHGSELESVNRRIAGRVLDFTHNHGADNRIYSPSLCEKRDLYIYLPPCYDPSCQYPLIFTFHGFGYDETLFLKQVDLFDRAMRSGQFPPCIIAAPDGSIRGRPSLLNAGSFFINSNAGRFEDYIMGDLWDFMFQNFPLRPEREAHAFLGASMGGFGAYNLGIKHRDRVAVVAGIFPPLNLRYLDCHGRYFANFDPDCLGIRERLRPNRPIARFGPILVRARRLTDPLVGRGPDAIARIARDNPVEMLAAYDVRPGELEMYVGYGANDEFNIDAQVESFIAIAVKRGLTITAQKDPEGRHNTETGVRLFPAMADWLAVRLRPYAPPCGE